MKPRITTDYTDYMDDADFFLKIGAICAIRGSCSNFTDREQSAGDGR